MNRFISRLDSEPGTPKPSGAGGYGFQVLRNKNIDLAIEPWFDFIIGINGRTIVRAIAWGRGYTFTQYRTILSPLFSLKKYAIAPVLP